MQKFQLNIPKTYSTGKGRQESASSCAASTQSNASANYNISSCLLYTQTQYICLSACTAQLHMHVLQNVISELNTLSGSLHIEAVQHCTASQAASLAVG